MPAYKLTLTDEEGTVLDHWKIDPTGEDRDAWDTRKSAARADLVIEIHDAIETRQADRDAGR